MKINPIINPNILRSYQATKPTKETTKPASNRDEVTFSAEALSFSKALSEAREAIELRTPEEKKHIADLKDAVSKGEYRVDSEDIADKILSSILGRS
ncbi:MAG: flagellar biosynthesis anti-sigma factor FlgM [Oscillospiraceae bacterium]|jgi:flagellar biosynthesis anti-sigma factor FlgM|nr:flagellar biosynthesis anti-sigma factor FlgM [Oscillospiraceae bacterium]